MCTSPRVIFVRGGRHFGSESHCYTVPCGRCDECLQSNMNGWSIRIIEQFKDTPEAYFITLTYAPRSVPYSIDLSTGEMYLSACKQHVQKALKRFKINLSRQGRDFNVRPLPYFLSAEYGSDPGVKGQFRPHYHMILFNVTRDECLMFVNDWRKKYGIVDWSRVRSAVACGRYCGKYICKGDFQSPLEKAGKVVPSFKLVSHGLGKGYIDRMKEFHLKAPSGIKKHENLYPFYSNVYYSKRYCEYVADNLVYRNQYLTNSVSGEVKRMQLPRYYKERILGHTILVAGSRAGTFKKVLFKSSLQFSVASAVFQRRQDDFDSKLAAFASENGFRTSFEALPSYQEMEARALEERALLARAKIINNQQKRKKIHYVESI